MSAGPSRSSGSQAPRWAILPEPSPSAAPSDDDRASTQDMHDELDPTPPASQAQPRPTKKRKPDVPASEDERAARNKLLKKAKVPQDAGGGERERQVEPEPGPSLQPKGPMASPLDSVQPRRRQIAMKRVSRGRPFQLQFEFEKDVRASQPATPSALAPPAAKPTAASSKPPPATQPAPRDSSAFRMPRSWRRTAPWATG
ncbi:uncharacterized protein B0H18DRAFT_413006 [Fomitopsis serialis]|uniref:uncharacterized protein n=1 Tax=Fomitopsis serialis TaxID=139415 RepID=UPI002008372E|nr:uncharacterized protein B0H18DRAFT_413006 [Neoantrodia serialis]KAH9935452.1 hypothetical protein B0H18DRAFT_413006 [Neoantrodia serialis]